MVKINYLFLKIQKDQLVHRFVCLKSDAKEITREFLSNDILILHFPTGTTKSTE